MKKNLGLKEMFLILKKRVWLIAAITVLGGLLAVFVTHYMMTPLYDASTRILVTQTNAKSSTLYDTNAVQTNVQLVNTYSVMIDDPVVLNQVIKKLNLQMSAGELQSMLTVNPVTNAQIFSLTAESTNPEQAVRIVNGVASELKLQVRKMMNVNNVAILSPATLSASSSPVSPNLHKNVTVGVALGLLLALSLAFLLEYLDNTVNTEEDIEKKLGLPVIGIISHMSRHGKKENPVPVSEKNASGQVLSRGRRQVF